MTTAYVQVIAVCSTASNVLHEVFTSCLRAVPLDGQFEIVDERNFPGTTDIAKYVFKLNCPKALMVANETVKPFLTTDSGDVSISVFSLHEHSSGLDATSDVEVFYYRDETKIDGLANWTDSCVRLVHKQTGVEASCQAYRSRALNYAEAMSLLRAKLFSRSAGGNNAV